MTAVLLHFFAGMLGALAVYFVFIRLAGATSFSAPFGVIFIGIACAALSHFVSPWATPVIIVGYAAAGTGEYLQDQEST